METCARAMVSDFNGMVVSHEDYVKPMTDMGDSGLELLNNFSKKKKLTKPKIKACDTDKDSKMYDTDDEAIEFALKTFGVKLRKKSTTAAKVLLQKNGQNPTKEYLIKRMWGLDEHNRIRMVPTNEMKWCVYWRPSILKEII
jgi:hypothetical protein